MFGVLDHVFFAMMISGMGLWFFAYVTTSLHLASVIDESNMTHIQR